VRAAKRAFERGRAAFPGTLLERLTLVVSQQHNGRRQRRQQHRDEEPRYGASPDAFHSQGDPGAQKDVRGDQPGQPPPAKCNLRRHGRYDIIPRHDQNDKTLAELVCRGFV